MRKQLRIFTAATLIALFILSSVGVRAGANIIKINGEVAEIPEGMGQVYEKDDRTFVPLRFVSEFLKNEVWYAEDTKTATISSEDFLLFVQDGNTTLFSVENATGETREVQMDTSAYIEPTEGRMYLPIRFLAEAIGYTVGWDEATETVTLDKDVESVATKKQEEYEENDLKRQEEQETSDLKELSCVTNVSKSVMSVGGNYRIAFSVSVEGRGGEGDYKYRYEIYQNGKLNKKCAYAKENKFEGNLTGSGECIFKVYVKDSDGAEVSKDIILNE